METKVSLNKKINLFKILHVFEIIIPFVGLFVRTDIMSIVLFSLASLYVFFAKNEVQEGLGLLWYVQVEPAPSDILFVWVWVKNLVKKQLKWPSVTSLHWFIAFAFLNILQLFWVSSLQRGFFFAFTTVYMISLAILFASSHSYQKTTTEKYTYYITAVVITAILIVLLSLLRFSSFSNILQNYYFGNRPKGFFKDPNVAGPFVVTGCLYAITKILILRKSIFSKFGFLFFATLLSSILTFSRGALLNLLVGFAVIILVTLWDRKFFSAFKILLFVVFLIIAIGPFLLKLFGQTSRFYSLMYYDIFGRFNAWRAGLMLFRYYPFGIGPGQFENYSIAYETLIPNAIITPSAHSLYIRVLSENGILGFISLVIALLALVSELIKSIRFSIHSNNHELLADGTWLFSSLFGILIESFVIDTLHWRHFWIIVGFAISYIVLSKRNIKVGGNIE